MCGFESGPQDNWLITQFINNTKRQQYVYIRVKYAISRRCTSQAGCLFTLDMFIFHTNEVNQSFVRDISVFGRQPVAVLTDTHRDGTVVTRVVRISADLSTSGFFVAFRDLGICISIHEIKIFYPYCDNYSEDLQALFPMDQFPGDTSVGSCLTNRAIDMNSLNDSFEATCTVTMPNPSELFTNWTVSNDLMRCMCLPGYMENYQFRRYSIIRRLYHCDGKLVLFCMQLSMLLFN